MLFRSAPHDAPVNKDMPTPEQKERGSRRLAEANAYREQKVRNLSNPECRKFLEKETGDSSMRKKLLEVLTEKDRTDCISQVLEEHLKFALPYEKNMDADIFVPYVLNPRVDDEVLQKYRKTILEQLSEEEKNMLQKEPAKIWKWIEDKIISSPEKERSSVITTPSGCLKTGTGSLLSKKILFVAMARTLGIPARLNPHDRSMEYMKNGKFISVSAETEKKALHQKIGVLFQGSALFDFRTVLGNIMFPMELAKVPGDKAEARARELLELVGLPDKADAYPAQLSGGQKQRIAIARALATDPKVLLCDEATSALDPNTTHAILQLIQKINRELGITVVIITHQMSVVEEVCNRVAILDNGTVVEEGEVQAIFSHPTSKAARRLVYPAGAPQAEVLPGHKLVRVAFGGTQTTDKPLVASLAIECGALVSIMAADTRIVNGQTLGSMLLALPDDDKAAAALEYIRNYPGITFEEVNG